MVLVCLSNARLKMMALLIGCLTMFLALAFSQVSPAKKQPTATANAYVEPGACAECHAEIATSYSQTGMAHSFYRPTSENTIEDYTGNNQFYHQASDTYFAMRHGDGKFFQKRWQTGYDGTITNIEELQIDYVMGSGRHARTYLHRNANGTLVELPLGWYSEKSGHWGMNPGYDNAQPPTQHMIPYECMFCHNGYPAIPEPQGDTIAYPTFSGDLPQGVGCQRCHGPGKNHIEAANSTTASVQQIRTAILNPARLNPQRQMEVCMQCHLEPTSRPLPAMIRRYDQEPFGYTPSKSLSSFVQYFDKDLGGSHDDRFEIAGAPYRLRQSQCFIKSGGAVTCELCHDPHQPHDTAAAKARYTTVCLKCHEPALSPLVLEKKHTARQDCATCHMPKRRTDDVVHVVMTDHLIQRFALPEDKLLAEKKEVTQTAANGYRGEVMPYRVNDFRASDDSLYTATAQVMHDSNLKVGIPRLEAAIAAQRPPRPDFSIELGDALRRSGQMSRAITAYRKAAALDPSSTRARRGLGTALADAGKPYEAVVELKQGIQRDPKDPLLWYQLGLVHSQLEQRDEAVKDLNEAIRLDPNLFEAYNNLGLNLAQMGDQDQAEQAFRTSIRLMPYDAAAQANLGQLLAGRGDLRQSAFHLEKAIRFDAKQPNSRYVYAAVLAQLNRFDDAQQQVKAAIAINPAMPQAHDLYGLILLQDGKGDAASAEFRRALKSNPALSPAHLHLAMALMQTGDRVGALAELRIAASAPDPGIAQQAREMEMKLEGH
jgi:predicted CXXCH cytochrome family protein